MFLRSIRLASCKEYRRLNRPSLSGCREYKGLLMSMWCASNRINYIQLDISANRTQGSTQRFITARMKVDLAFPTRASNTGGLSPLSLFKSRKFFHPRYVMIRARGVTQKLSDQVPPVLATINRALESAKLITQEEEVNLRVRLKYYQEK